MATALWKNTQASVVLFKNTQSCLIILNPKIQARNSTFLYHIDQRMQAKGSFLLWNGLLDAYHLSHTLSPSSFNNLSNMKHMLSESEAFKPNDIVMISSRFWFCHLIFKILVQRQVFKYLPSLKAVKENILFLRTKYCTSTSFSVFQKYQVKQKSPWLHLIFRETIL